MVSSATLIEEDEVFALVGDVGPEVGPDDAVPGRAVLLVEVGLDVLGDLHLGHELLDRVRGQVVDLLLHLAVLVHCAGGPVLRHRARRSRPPSAVLFVSPM